MNVLLIINFEWSIFKINSLNETRPFRQMNFFFWSNGWLHLANSWQKIQSHVHNTELKKMNSFKVGSYEGKSPK